MPPMPSTSTVDMQPSDWSIAGEMADLSMSLPQLVTENSFRPSAADIPRRQTTKSMSILIS